MVAATAIALALTGVGLVAPSAQASTASSFVSLMYAKPSESGVQSRHFDSAPHHGCSGRTTMIQRNLAERFKLGIEH